MTGSPPPNLELAPKILSVQVDRTFDNVYIPTVLLDDRLLVTLDRERAPRYACAWADATARAQHDAAVFAQLTGRLRLPVDVARAVITKDLRPDRPPLDAAATAPLRLEPILASRTKRGLVGVWIGDEELSQFDAPEVHNHIANVLFVAMTCDLDAAYLRLLTGTIGVAEGTAVAAVGDLATWRAAEVEGAERDTWVRQQFAGITEAMADRTPEEFTGPVRRPWQAKRNNKPKKNRK